MDPLQNFIAEEISKLTFKRVGPGDSLIQSRLLDSILLVELPVSIEERIGKQIPQHLITQENFDTVEKIAATVNGL